MEILLRHDKGEGEAARVDSNGPVYPRSGTVHAPAIVVKVTVRIRLQQDAVTWVVDGGGGNHSGGDGPAGEERDEPVH